MRPQQVGENLVARPGRTARAPGACLRGTATGARESPAAARPSRYSSAVPRRPGSSVCRPRKAIRSGSGGSTSESSVKTCARLRFARSFTNSSTKNTRRDRRAGSAAGGSPRPAGRRRLRAGRPRRSGSRSIRMRGFFSTIAASDRAHWKRTSNRWSSRPSSRPSAARCDDADREDARQAPAHGEFLVRIDQRVDELADVLFGHRRSALTASPATGSQASSGMTCGTSAAASGSSDSQHAQDAIAVARSERENLQHLRVELAEHAGSRAIATARASVGDAL